MFKIKNNNSTINKKIAVTFVAAIFLIILYFLIFSFSEQDGEESANSSYTFTYICTEIINHLSGNQMTTEKMESLALYWEHPVRKLAHFTEYAVMGVLIITILNQWMNKNRKKYLIAFLWLFFSASLDELHQLFVPGRYSNFADVCLDTSGGITGILLITIMINLYVKHKNIACL